MFAKTVRRLIQIRFHLCSLLTEGIKDQFLFLEQKESGVFYSMVLQTMATSFGTTF